MAKITYTELADGRNVPVGSVYEQLTAQGYTEDHAQAVHERVRREVAKELIGRQATQAATMRYAQDIRSGAIAPEGSEAHNDLISNR